MKQDEIALSDIARLVFGQNPPTFLLEVVGRAVICFVLIIACWVAASPRNIRCSSCRRWSLWRAPWAYRCSMTSAGCVPPLVIIGSLLALQHLSGHLSLRSRRFDRLLASSERVVLDEGRLQLETLRATVLPREKLFSLLRGRGVQHLGQLSRIY